MYTYICINIDVITIQGVVLYACTRGRSPRHHEHYCTPS